MTEDQLLQQIATGDGATDHQLLVRVAARDTAALETLYERHAAALQRRLEHMTRDPATAADLLQEVFLRVWERAEQFTGEGQPLAWLYRIATNLALNHLDAARRRRQQPLEMAAGAEDDDESPLPGWLIDEAAIAPDAALEALEQRRLVRGVIDALPEAKRDVIHLAYDAQLGVADIAERLGVPEGTVKSRLHYARRQVAAGWREITRRWEDD